MRQLADVVQVQSRDSILVVVGDFNIPRGSRLYREFLVHSGLTDLLAGDSRPTLRVPFRVPTRHSLAIDYVLVRIPEPYALEVECDLCFSDQYPIHNERQGYLSDHHGIELRMTATSRR